MKFGSKQYNGGMQLVLPSVKYEQSYCQALEEGKDEIGITVLRKPKVAESFSEFVKNILGEAKGLNLLKGWVPASEFWLVDKGEFIGRVSIRHTLNDHLLKIGGHIGYYIRASKRKMGYGKEILKLALLKAKKLGLKKVLVTCDEGNIGSQKIIEASNGVLEDIVEVGNSYPRKKRFWIALDC